MDGANQEKTMTIQKYTDVLQFLAKLRTAYPRCTADKQEHETLYTIEDRDNANQTVSIASWNESGYGFIDTMPGVGYRLNLQEVK